MIDPVWCDIKYDKLVKRRRGLQRKLSRKREAQKKENRNTPSKNYFKTLHKLRVVNRHISEFKKSFRVKVSKEITKNNPSIVVLEDLGVSDMLKNKALSPRIHEVGWYALRRQVAWEQEKKVAKVAIVDRYFPSSKMCSKCGYINPDLTLSDRLYCCGVCGNTLDRDLNAAINLSHQAFSVA